MSGGRNKIVVHRILSPDSHFAQSTRLVLAPAVDEIGRNKYRTTQKGVLGRTDIVSRLLP